VYLTIDASVQVVAADSFPDTIKGAVIAIDPRDGSVLAMYSSPSIDPNIFSASVAKRAKNWGSIALDPNLPLNNRSISGVYTPGSTYKLISATAGLLSGKLTGDMHMPTPCHGSYRLGNRLAHCWDLRGHGSLDLVGAIKQSCDVYFYQVGLRLGDQIINNTAKMFGLGQPTGIDLPGEKGGWLSGEEEYNKRFASKGWVWTRGLLMDMAIGQTQLVTPLQLATLVGGLGNGHEIYKPYLLKEVRSVDGAVYEQRSPVLYKKLTIDSVSLAVLHTALVEVMEAGGTGGRGNVPGIPVGGKTGSAENMHGEKTHALFMACAPINNPIIAVSTVLENAGHGGSVAAPVAGAVLRYFFANTVEGKAVTAAFASEAALTKQTRGN
jgi:penicillin-binding protein 2